MKRILVPYFNEERTIGKVVTDWKPVLPEAGVYVYNNNSTDRTAAFAADAGAIVRYARQGKAVSYARDCCILVDGTYPAKAWSRLVDMVTHGGTDMVVGNRLSGTYKSVPQYWYPAFLFPV